MEAGGDHVSPTSEHRRTPSPFEALLTRDIRRIFFFSFSSHSRCETKRAGWQAGQGGGKAKFMQGFSGTTLRVLVFILVREFLLFVFFVLGVFATVPVCT